MAAEPVIQWLKRQAPVYLHKQLASKLKECNSADELMNEYISLKSSGKAKLS